MPADFSKNTHSIVRRRGFRTWAFFADEDHMKNPITCELQILHSCLKVPSPPKKSFQNKKGSLYIKGWPNLEEQIEEERGEKGEKERKRERKRERESWPARCAAPTGGWGGWGTVAPLGGGVVIPLFSERNSVAHDRFRHYLALFQPFWDLLENASKQG